MSENTAIRTRTRTSPGTNRCVRRLHVGAMADHPALVTVRQARGLTTTTQNPLSSPVYLSLTTPPLHLTFSPPAQRLSRIQVTGPNPGSHVAYRQQRLQSGGADNNDDEEDEDEREDVVKRIRTILGPTFGSSKAPTVKGTTEEEEEEEEEEENMFCYPGVAFGVQKTRSGTRVSSLSSSFRTGG